MKDDLAAKFSPLMNCLHDTQRRKFLHYLDAKIREKALVLSWRERPGDRMESLSARVVDFNQERGLRDTIAGQERKIKDLESQLKTEDEKKHATRLELSSLQQQLKAQKQDHLTQLATQSRFHDANMVTITRLKNKLTNCKAKVEGLSGQITATLDGVGGGQEKKRKKKKKGGAGTEEDAVEEEEGEEEEQEEQETESRVSELVNNVQELLQQYLHEKEQARRSRSQQEEVLKLVNKPQCKESVVTVVKEVLKHEQKHRALVMRDIQRLSDTFRQVVPSSTLAPPTPIGVTPTEMSLHGPPLDPATLDTKHFKSQLAMLKAEAEHIQKRFQWKDSETANLRQELFAVKQRFHDYKIIASGHRPPPHHHTTPPASLSPQHLVCASCGRNMLPQNRGSHPNLPNSSPHTVQFSAASKRLFQDEEEHFQAEDMPPEGWDDRRGSMGRSDLDKTVVDVEEYLLDSEGPDYFGEAATVDDALIREACHLPKETVNSAVHHGGAASTKSPPVKGAAETKSGGGGGGGGGGESKSRRDQAKTVAAWSKARVKRKLMSK